jgi:hypothetical protein
MSTTITFQRAPCPVCTTMLPEHVREDMAEALKIDPNTAPGYSFSRTLALDKVIAKAKLHYPHLFR